MSTLFQDLKFALRMLAKNPGFTAVAVITLVLGIGVNTATFSVVNAVILRPLPFHDAKRVFVIGKLDATKGTDLEVTVPEFLYWKEHSGGFEDLGALTLSTKHLGEVDQSGPVSVMTTSANYFRLLGVQPRLGRSFLPGEDRTGFNHVVVISDGLWLKAFGSDPHVIGRGLRLDHVSYSIIGVMPRKFFDPNLGSAADLWTPLAVDSPTGSDQQARSVIVLGRLKPGIEPMQARTQLEATAGGWRSLDPKDTVNLHLELDELQTFAKGWTSPFLVLFGAASFILLIACANLGNLLLARANTRQKEIAVRTALGAGRLRILRQILVETLILTLSGGLAAIMLAKWAIPLLLSVSPEGFPRLHETTVDGKVFVYALLICVAAGVAVGLVSGLHSTGSKTGNALCERLKEAGGGMTSTFRGGRSSRILVVCEIALALPLSVGAGLMIRSFLNLRPTDIGFDPQSKLTVHLRMPWKYRTGADRLALFEDLLHRVQAVPGIESVCGANFLPLGGSGHPGHVTILGQAKESSEQRVELRVVSDNYFQVMRVKRLSGRFLAKSDNGNGPPVVTVNLAMAEAFWPGENPLGKQLIVHEIDPNKVWSVIGVVGDERLFSGNTRRYPQVYSLYSQHPEPWVNLVIYTTANPAKLKDLVRKQVLSVDKDIDLLPIMTMEDMLGRSFLRPRFFAILLGIFAVLALSLASVGVYGVMSYSTSQRTHEIGLRLALGAQRRDVINLVIRQGLVLTGLGVTIGLGGGVALTRLLTTLIYGVKPIDPLTFALATLTLASVALLASYIPARRAAKVDPMVALRYE